MKPSEIFALLLRVVGVLCLIYLVRNLTNNWVDMAFPKEAAYYISRVIYLGIGLYLIRGAGVLVQFAYPGESKSGMAKPTA